MKIKQIEGKVKRLDLGTKGIKELLSLVKEVHDILSSLNEKKFNVHLNEIKGDLESYLMMDKEWESVTFINRRQKLFADSKQTLLEIILKMQTY